MIQDGRTASQFSLVREMHETVKIVENLDVGSIYAIPLRHENAFFSGEGSSRIFPGKHLVRQALKQGYPGVFHAEGGYQSREYNLSDYDVFIASNSGRTAECVDLLRHLKETGHDSVLGISAFSDSILAQESDFTLVLSCGEEKAVAATKSVIEQALTYDILYRHRNGIPAPDLGRLSSLIHEAMTMPLPGEIVETVATARKIYFAGRNDGVAEELTLKTNEIVRKPSDYLEGTYLLHGIEETMVRDEVIILIDSFEESEAKIESLLRQRIGIPVYSLSSRKTGFPGIVLPSAGDESAYVQLAAGWNLLVEAGLHLGIDLDTPERTRKVGNEFTR